MKNVKNVHAHAPMCAKCDKPHFTALHIDDKLMWPDAMRENDAM